MNQSASERKHINQEQSDYDTWHGHNALSDDTQSIWHKFVKEEICKDNIHGSIILEIGCGRGGLTHYVATLPQGPAKVYGCDFSENALSIARSRYGEDPCITWQKEDVQSLSFPDNTFDRIISCETIEHVPHPQMAIRELHRVLKPGGLLYLTCPNYFNFFGLWCIYRYLIGKPYTEFQPYVNYILLPQLVRWLKKQGFIIISLSTAELILPLRAHYRFFENRLPSLLRSLGHRTFFVLKKQIT